MHRELDESGIIDISKCNLATQSEEFYKNDYDSGKTSEVKSELKYDTAIVKALDDASRAGGGAIGNYGTVNKECKNNYQKFYEKFFAKKDEGYHFKCGTPHLHFSIE